MSLIWEVHGSTNICSLYEANAANKRGMLNSARVCALCGACQWRLQCAIDEITCLFWNVYACVQQQLD